MREAPMNLVAYAMKDKVTGTGMMLMGQRALSEALQTSVLNIC
jgi:hypothetical protein